MRAAASPTAPDRLRGRTGRGSVMHMLRADAEHFQGFGEIYFSTVNPGAIKGWHIHREMTSTTPAWPVW
jgi:dTDP-4-dehydrorhamnose 3,5-epimerase-like enzyme